MSELKLISPLLDGFVPGKMMRERNGVRSCPVLKEETKEKYVCKIISVPASQVQLDALILTGAYKSASDAVDYFRDMAAGVEAEAKFLKSLSQLEGFVPFESWQVVPMEDGRTGFEVFLLSPYRHCLERFLRHSVMTHLDAINLALDLCTAMAICRRSGYLYVNLKPGNIFITKKREFRVGDLGFVDLNTLSYTSLPKKYCSAYSPPEVRDDLNTLNDTVDTYGIGMILYEIYNNGVLPKATADSQGTPITPVNADYELAQIIMKAIAPDPADRWKTPMEMGQALVGYMQRNSVNRTPIAPAAPIVMDPVPALQQQPEDISIPRDDATQEAAPPEEASAEAEPVAAGVSVSHAADWADADSIPSVSGEYASVSGEYTSTSCIPISDDSESAAEKDPSAMDTSDDPYAVYDRTPDEFPMEPELSDLDEFLSLLSDEQPLADSQEDEIPEPRPIVHKDREAVSQRRSTVGRIAAILVTLLILGAIAGGGFYFYRNIFLQKIDGFSVTGSQTKLAVKVDTQVDESGLYVTCTDTYGNVLTQKIVNGEAEFTELLPDSLYRIELHTEGFHQLVGPTSEIFTTEAITNVVAISPVTGPEDGSVILNLTIDGSDPGEWMVTCSAEGEQDIVKTFTGRNVTVKGLALGKEYTIQLSASDGSALLGNTSAKFVAAKLVMAENLTIVSCDNGKLTARWDIPEGMVVESWNVRMYNDAGYEERLETTQTQVEFTNVDTTRGYTIEVTASGMTQPTRASITANPITLNNLNVDSSDPGKLTVTWDYSGADPKDGWLLLYSFDNAKEQSVVKAKSNSAEISPRIPGTKYRIEIQAADNTTVFNGIHAYSSPNAQVFEKHGLSADNITADLLKTPSDSQWTFETVDPAAFTSTFASGDSISVVLKAGTKFYLPKDEMEILYVIRDGEGNVLSDYISQAKKNWEDIWYAGDYQIGELDVPSVPKEPGEYSLSIYFNNAAITYTTFTIQ